MKKLIITTVFAALFSSNAMADDYVIDTKGAHASVQFQIKHLGYSWLTGRFNDFEGEFSYDKNNIENSKISVKIDVGSIDSNHAERDKHLRNKDFLNVSENPESTFISKKVVDKGDGKIEITGDFTLNGVTNSVVIPASIVGEGEDPWGGYRVGFRGETRIALKDYNINYDLGSDSTHVNLLLDVEGVKK